MHGRFPRSQAGLCEVLDQINFGYVTLSLKYGDKATDAQSALEARSSKVRLALVVLAVSRIRAPLEIWFQEGCFSATKARKRILRLSRNHIETASTPWK